MSILSDLEILNYVKSDDMISPFNDRLISYDSDNKKIISYGLSSYGYDARLSNNFYTFKSLQFEKDLTVDPKNFNENIYKKEIKDDFCIIPPNGFVLSNTVEYFKIPKNIIAICIGKSTYARCGLIVNVTPIEPEWEGQITLEISNTTSLPVKIYPNEGICQLLFMRADSLCSVSYKDRNGKYLYQKNITLPKI